MARSTSRLPARVRQRQAAAHSRLCRGEASRSRGLVLCPWLENQEKRVRQAGIILGHICPGQSALTASTGPHWQVGWERHSELVLARSNSPGLQSRRLTCLWLTDGNHTDSDPANRGSTDRTTTYKPAPSTGSTVLVIQDGEFCLHRARHPPRHAHRGRPPLLGDNIQRSTQPGTNRLRKPLSKLDNVAHQDNPGPDDAFCFTVRSALQHLELTPPQNQGGCCGAWTKPAAGWQAAPIPKLKLRLITSQTIDGVRTG